MRSEAVAPVPETAALAELAPLARLPEQRPFRRRIREFLSETARRQDAQAQAGRVSGSITAGRSALPGQPAFSRP